MEIQDIIIQAIGYIGLIFAIIAFQCKSHKGVMIFRTLNEMFFVVQYLCLGSYTGAAMNIIGSTRNISFAACVEKNKSTKPLQIIFCIIFVVAGLMTTPVGIVQFMVIGAKIVSTIAYGMKNTTLIRLLTLPTSICWFVYNFSCGSVAGSLCEALTIISIFAAIIRIDIIGKRKQKLNAKKA